MRQAAIKKATKVKGAFALKAFVALVDRWNLMRLRFLIELFNPSYQAGSTFVKRKRRTCNSAQAFPGDIDFLFVAGSRLV
jgi:hypothetical protein